MKIIDKTDAFDAENIGREVVRDDNGRFVARDRIIPTAPARTREEEAYARGRHDLAREVFALHEDTIERYHDVGQRDSEGKMGAFARGRCAEAKSIARAISNVVGPKPDALDAAQPAPQGEPFEFVYRNWRGEIARRRATQLGVLYGSTEWHPEPQWFLCGFDLDKQDFREYAMKDINPPLSEVAAPPPADAQVRERVPSDVNQWRATKCDDGRWIVCSDGDVIAECSFEENAHAIIAVRNAAISAGLLADPARETVSRSNIADGIAAILSDKARVEDGRVTNPDHLADLILRAFPFLSDPVQVEHLKQELHDALRRGFVAKCDTLAARDAEITRLREAVADVIALDEQNVGLHSRSGGLRIAADHARAALSATAGGERVRHVKRGSDYTVLFRGATLQTDKPLSDFAELVVYQGDNGMVWVRPVAEFNDGRFIPAPSAPERQP